MIAFDEDKRVLEAIQASRDEMPVERPLMIASDAGCARMHRRLDDLMPASGPDR